MTYIFSVLIFGLFVALIEQCRVNYKILKDIEELKKTRK